MKELLAKIGATACLIGAAALSMAQIAGLPQFRTVSIPIVIATGNTFQTILAASTNRRSIEIQNNNTTDSCWIAFGYVSGTAITAGTATKAGSFVLTSGGSFQRYTIPPGEEVEGTCTTTSDTMIIHEQ